MPEWPMQVGDKWVTSDRCAFRSKERAEQRQANLDPSEALYEPYVRGGVAAQDEPEFVLEPAGESDQSEGLG